MNSGFCNRNFLPDGCSIGEAIFTCCEELLVYTLQEEAWYKLEFASHSQASDSGMEQLRTITLSEELLKL